VTVKVIEVIKLSSALNLCDATGTTTAELRAILNEVLSVASGKESRRQGRQ
jgi:hypothetical protein